MLRRDAPKWAATATFSRIESFRNGRGIWNVRATPRWQIASGVSPAISSPRKRIDPAVGWRAPEMQLNIVVLPGAVRADEPEDLPLGDLEGDVVERGEAAEALDERRTPPGAASSTGVTGRAESAGSPPAARGWSGGRGPRGPRPSDQRAANGEDAGRITGGLFIAMTLGHTCWKRPSTIWYTAAMARSFCPRIGFPSPKNFTP